MSVAFICAIGVFALVFILRVPLALGMLATGFTYLAISGGTMSIVATNMINSYYAGFTIIAVPLFIFTANAMNSGKITERLFAFCDGLVGRFRGGMGHVNVLCSLIFAGMTGSAIADVSGLGKIEIEAMNKQGYDPEFSCAVTGASAVLGPIFPPSQIMLIYSMLSGASVGALFMAGLVPAVLIAAALMIYVAYISHKRQYPYGMRYTLRQFLVVTLKAIPALLTPIILLGGIYTGVMTPTESAAIAGLYALIVSMAVYRAVGWRELWKILRESAIDVGRISIIVGAASCLKYIFAREKLAEMLGSFLVGTISSKPLFLLLVLLFFLVLGMFLETSTIVLVFTPLILPTLETFGIDLVHYGIITTVGVMLGLCTPPYGSCLFITSAISGTPLKAIIKEALPMVGMMVLVLLLITFCPDLVLFVPRLFID